MSKQSVILPNISLFLVDRGWPSRPGKVRSGHTAASYQLEPHIVQENAPLDNNALKMINQPWVPALTAPWCKKQGNSSGDPCSGRSKTPKSFEFINATQPGHARDPAVQRLVKSHVRKGLRSGRTVRSASQATSVAPSDESSELRIARKRDQGTATLTASGLNSTRASGSSSPLYGNGAFPVPTGSRSQVLLSYYLYAVAPSWYPLEAHLTSNPVRVGWFSLAMTDEVLFRSVLFSSASHLAVKNGCPEGEEPSTLVSLIFRQLNQRLQARSGLSDATIGILTCLAMVEIALGNYDKWKIHMTAMKEMIRLRGGLSRIEGSLQMKVCRADTEGASDTLTPPNLSALPRSYPPICSTLPNSEPYPARNHLLDILIQSDISPQLQTIILRLQRLNHAVAHAISHHKVLLDPRALDEDSIQVQHDLLALPYPTSNDTTQSLYMAFSSTSPPSSVTTAATSPAYYLNEAVRLAALLYAKSLTRSTSSIPLHSRPIVRRLAVLLPLVYSTQAQADNITNHPPHEASLSFSSSLASSTDSSPSPSSSTSASLKLRRWLHFMGGIATRRDGSSEREIFIDGLAGLVAGSCDMVTWDSVEKGQEEMLWIPAIHGSPGRMLWDECVGTVVTE